MKKIIKTNNAPSAIGPYNQAVVVDNTIYTSGQIAIDPISGELVLDDIAKETEQVLNNLKALLSDAGFNMTDIVQCSVFVNDMHQYAQINEVYARYFPAERAPARTLVEVRNLPKFVNIEISAIAIKS